MPGLLGKWVQRSTEAGGSYVSRCTHFPGDNVFERREWVADGVKRYHLRITLRSRVVTIHW